MRLLSNLLCEGIYVSNWARNEGKRWKIGDTHGTIVAGENRHGINLEQLNFPSSLFVDRDHSVYVLDNGNHRVVKWLKGAKKGVLVAGGQGGGRVVRLVQM